MKLELLQPNATIRGIVHEAVVMVGSVQWFSEDVLEITFKTADEKVANQLLYRDDEPRLLLVEEGRP